MEDIPKKKKKIGIKKGGVPSSPFIVRLSHGEEELGTHDPIAALSESLIIDGDDEGDEAPLVEALDGGTTLAITYDEFRSQLGEDRGDGEEIITEAPMPLPERTAHPALVVHPIVPEELEVVHVFADDAPRTHVRDRIVRVFSSKRAIASFVLIALLLSLPLHAAHVFADVRDTALNVEDQGSAALDAFLRGATSLNSNNFDAAGNDFSQAAEDFANAEDSLTSMHAIVVAAVNVMPETDRTVSSVRHLASAGEELATTAEILALAGEDITGKTSLNLVAKIDLLSAYVSSAIPHVEEAAEHLEYVDESVLPAEYQGNIRELKSTVPSLATAFEEFVDFTDALVMMLGGDGQVRYLAVFQNNTEIRPTGGFVGSFAELDVRDGELERLSVPTGGSYATQGQLTEYVAAPGPLQLLRARWEFQDANWFPDFPTSARKLLWFEEHSGGPTMDGVIAVNASFLVDLLEILGPVDMPLYGRTITAENVLLETQKIVELEYDKAANTPKAFIGDLAPILLERVTDADFPTLLAVLSLVGKGLEEKEIIVYFRENELQAAMERLSFTGSVKQTSGDSLMVVNTNVGGGKTDGVIDEVVTVDVEIGEDGSVINTVTVTRTHRGMKHELFRGVNNVNYLRLYVPEGSELLSGSGFTPPADDLFEKSDVPLAPDDDLLLSMKNLRKDGASGTDIWEEQGKTVFGNWVQTSPGETSTTQFSYRLPFTISLEEEKNLFQEAHPVPYTLFIQKQPGIEMRRTSVRVSLPRPLEVVWTSQDANPNVTGTATNERDAFFGWLFQP